MYRPQQTGIPRNLTDIVHYHEFLPDNAATRKIVSCFWILDSSETTNDFEYLVLPDGCIDVVFDVSLQPEFTGALIMTPSLKTEHVRIRPKSIYAGIRLLPGAWQSNPVQFIGKGNVSDTLAGYSFVEAHAQQFSMHSQAETIKALTFIAAAMETRGMVKASSLVNVLLAGQFTSVQEMIVASGYSRRQLQRILHQSVGYAPHDFLKILRFQYVLQKSGLAAERYADQSHFIRECKRITGMTPSELSRAYQLMSDPSNTKK